MSRVFVDTSAWYAAAAEDDASHRRAVRLLSDHAGRLATTDHVLVETWTLIRYRRNLNLADSLIKTMMDRSLVEVLTATPDDIRTALRIGELFSDQEFSMIDRTSWAVMERHAIEEAIAFGADFAVYRYGLGLRRAFTVHR